MTETETVETARVIDRQNRVLFDGPPDDAYAFVEANFPHVHVEPGTTYADGPTPDVSVQMPGGESHTFVGGEWLTDAEDDQPDADTDDETASPELPSRSDNAETWRSYARANNYPDDASTNKADIVNYYLGGE